MEVDVFVDEGTQIRLGSRTAMTMACVIVPEGKRQIFQQASQFIAENHPEWKWKHATQSKADAVFEILRRERIRAGFLTSPSDQVLSERFERDFDQYRQYLSSAQPQSPIPGVQNFLRMRMTAWIIHMALKYAGVEYQESHLPIALAPGYRVPVRFNFYIDSYSYSDTEQTILREGANEHAIMYRHVDMNGNYPPLQPHIGELRMATERETPAMLFPDYVCGMMTMEAIPTYRHSLLTGVVPPGHYAEKIRRDLPGPFYTANEFPTLRLPPQARLPG